MDEPAPLEIWQVAGLVVGRSEDARPCIVLRVLPNGDVKIAPLSASLALRGPPWQHFVIEAEHPDFPATGLTRTCYVLGDCLSTIERRQLARRRGKLQGELAKVFENWI